jgi:CRISPR system Cascade subunit CasB
MESLAAQISRYTEMKLKKIAELPESSFTRSTLANMRRGIGRAPGDMPELWGVFLQDMPEEMQGKGGAPSYAEWAVYTVLTMFSLHQQGWDPNKEPMYVHGEHFGRAVRKLVPPGDEDALTRVQRRFNCVATASDMKELSYYLRGLIQLLRAEGIPIDYPELASDLFYFQIEGSAPGIRLKWGQDFYFYQKTDNENKQTESEEIIHG